MPRYLISTSTAVGLLDSRTGRFERVLTADGPYYGLTWSDSHVYIGTQDGRVLVCAPDFSVADRIELSAVNMHGLHWHDGLWAADTGRDAIVRVTGAPGAWTIKRWQLPDGDRPLWKAPGDHWHINTVWVDRPGFVICVAHGGTFPSEAIAVDWATKGCSHAIVGTGCHDYAPTPSGLYVTDAGAKAIVGGGHAHELAGWVRGLAVTPTEVVAGISGAADRSRRHVTDGFAVVLSPELVPRQRWKLPRTGQVLAIRAVDAVDYGHHGVAGPPFPT